MRAAPAEKKLAGLRAAGQGVPKGDVCAWGNAFTGGITLATKLLREAHAAGTHMDRTSIAGTRYDRNIARKATEAARVARKAAKKAAKKKKRGRKKPKPKLPAQPFDYIAYLKSAHWRAKRKETLKYHGPKCDKCGTDENLQVHHKTYARLGREKMKDLQILCQTHHNELHEADPKWVARQQKKAAAAS